MSIDCLKDAEHWRERAEQIRTKAEAMCDQAVKRQMTFAHAPAGRGQTDAIARLRQADRDRGDVAGHELVAPANAASFSPKQGMVAIFITLTEMLIASPCPSWLWGL